MQISLYYERVLTTKHPFAQGSRVSVIHAPIDAASDLIPAGVADMVISNGVLNLSNRKPCAFRQAFDIAKPGARFCFADMVLVGIYKNMR